MRIGTNRQQQALLACGFLAGALAFSGVCGPYVTWDGEPLGLQVLSLTLLPIAATTIHVVMRRLRARGGTTTDVSSEAALDSIVLAVIGFLTGMHLLLLAVLLQVESVMPWASRGVILLLGVAIVVVGNLLPRTRPNVAFGVRTLRTLEDRELWMLTHRVTGYIAVGIGALTILSGMFLSGTRVAGLPGTAGTFGGLVLMAYYWKVSSASTRRHKARLQE